MVEMQKTENINVKKV